MQITTSSSKFTEQIAIDIVGPLLITNNQNRFILTIQNDLTKFIQSYTMPNHETTNIPHHNLYSQITYYRIKQLNLNQKF